MNPDFGPVIQLPWLHLWQVTIVAAVVAVIVRLTCRHRPRVAYALWMLVLIKALVPPVWASPTGVFSWALAENPAPPSVSAVQTAFVPTVARSGDASAVVRTPEMPKLDVRRTVTQRFSTVVFATWFLGFLAGSLVLLVRWRRWEKFLRRTAWPADLDCMSVVADFVERLRIRGNVRVLISSELIGPLVYGILRPTVVLPESLLRNASAEQVQLVLAHELIHVRRRDVFSGLLQTVARLLWWFYPVIWWVVREASRERERCCDQEVIAALGCRPVTYARTLLRVLELKVESRFHLAEAGIGHSRVTALRLEYIMKHAESRRRFATVIPRIVIALGLASLLPGMGLPADDRPKSEVTNLPASNGRRPPPPAGRTGSANRPITVTGRALDEVGQPVSGATIYLQSTNGIEARLGTTKTDREGRYEFRDAKLPVYQPFDEAPLTGTFEVFGTAPGKGFTWHEMRFGVVGRRPGSEPKSPTDIRYFEGEPIEMDLRFEPPALVKGRVIDEKGVPVVGAVVHLDSPPYRLNKVRGQDFGIWSIAGAPSELTSTKTGNDGRFELPGLPREASFQISFTHQDYAAQSLSYVTSNRPASEFDLAMSGKFETGELEVKFRSPRRLAIRVLKADTEEPAQGIAVSIGSNQAGPLANGVTDAKGSVEMKLPSGEYDVRLEPPRISEYIRTPARIRVEDRPQEQAAVFRVDRGCVLVVEVVDAETGKGIPGVSFTEDVPHNGQSRWRYLQLSTTNVETWKTDKDGRLRGVLKPSRLNIRIESLPHDSDYEIDSEPRTIDLVARGETVRARFELRKQRKPNP